MVFLAVGEEGVGHFEAVLGHQFGVGEDGFGLAVGDETTLAEEEDPAAEVEDHLEVMAGDESGVREGVELGDEEAPGARRRIGDG